MKLDILQKAIKDSGMTMTAIAEKSNIKKATLYNRFKGVGKFTVDEASSLGKVLHLSNKEQCEIFLE